MRSPDPRLNVSRCRVRFTPATATVRAAHLAALARLIEEMEGDDAEQGKSLRTEIVRTA